MELAFVFNEKILRFVIGRATFPSPLGEQMTIFHAQSERFLSKDEGELLSNFVHNN